MKTIIADPDEDVGRGATSDGRPSRARTRPSMLGDAMQTVDYGGC